MALQHHLKYLILLAVAAPLLFLSCLKSNEPGLPLEVVRVIQQTGHNKVEILKALAHYVESEDTAGRNALYFLISNMEKQYAVAYTLMDSAGNELSFNPLSYPNYQQMMKAWDSVSESPGGLMFKPTRYTLDRDTIKAELIRNTIQLALSSRRLPWAGHIPDSIFLRYVLPYRVANEDLEDWRSLLASHLEPLKNTADVRSPEELAALVNNHIEQNFTEDIRLIKQANVTKASQILHERMASPRDMAIFRVMALRSLGIPATLDYIPWLSDSLHSVWFASYYTSEHTWKPLLPATFERQLLNDDSRVPKIYRRIFHTTDSSLFAIKDLKKTTPPFLGHFHYLDVTSSYLQVRNLTYHGPCPDEFIYLAIHNGRNWKAVDWAFCKGDSASFRNIGNRVKTAFVWLEKLDDDHQLHLLPPRGKAD